MDENRGWKVDDDDDDDACRINEDPAMCVGIQPKVVLMCLDTKPAEVGLLRFGSRVVASSSH